MQSPFPKEQRTFIRQQQDPVSTFLRRSLPPQPPTSPTPPSLESLRSHAEAYRWADVLQQSTQLLSEDYPLPPDQALLIQTYRTLALLQTRQIQRATDAITALGDLSHRNDVYRYETYPEYNGKTGTFVPFQLRLLDVDICFRRGDIAAINDAYVLLDTAQADEKGALLSALASYHLKSGLYDTAIDVAKQFVAFRNDAAAFLCLTRVYLHIHDLENAEDALKRAVTAKDTRRDAVAAHRGMVLAARGRYEEALECYNEALEEGGESWVYATNNAAICLLQLGRVEKAIEMLEDALRKDPALALDEGLVFNLATLYELAYPDSVSEKKRVLRKVAERFGRQGFDLEGIGL